MRSRGLVQTTAERPRRYVAIAPKVLFERSLFERRRSLEEDMTLARELSERLPELTESVSEGAPRFEVLTGRAAIYPYLREMVGRSSASVEVLVAPKALRESARLGLYEALPRLLSTGPVPPDRGTGPSRQPAGPATRAFPSTVPERGDPQCSPSAGPGHDRRSAGGGGLPRAGSRVSGRRGDRGVDRPLRLRGRRDRLLRRGVGQG